MKRLLSCQDGMSGRDVFEVDGDLKVIWQDNGSVPQLSSQQQRLKAPIPSITTSLIPFLAFLPLPLDLSFSSRSFGSTSGRMLSMIRGKMGSRGLSSQLLARAGLSR